MSTRDLIRRLPIAELVNEDFRDRVKQLAGNEKRLDGVSASILGSLVLAYVVTTLEHHR